MTGAPANLLLCLQHADSAFPSGSFAFSQGLEGFAALAPSSRAGRPDSSTILAFVRTQLRHRWASADRVALIRAHRMAGDPDALSVLDSEVEASTMPAPLREGSRRNGAAYLSAHARLGVGPGVEIARAYRDRVRSGRSHGHLVVVQGLVWSALGIDETEAALISGYQFSASATQAAIRLGLIGALDAQTIVSAVRPDISELAGVAVPTNAAIEGYAPLADIAAMRHARQEVRLFAN